MKIYTYNDLGKEEIDVLCSRQLSDDLTVESTVKTIIAEVQSRGDEALRSYSRQFDKQPITDTKVSMDVLKAQAALLPLPVQVAINTAIQNIRTFHAQQVQREMPIETMPGVTCWRETRAIERVGLYVPGGTAVLPSTFLMLAIPALIAGCSEIVVCTPPNEAGSLHPAVAYCSITLGVSQIYLVGGAQAIAAMAYGTATIPRVNKIFGPGNRYVTTAKSMVQKHVAIDMPAGPSEVLVIADATANPAYVAADLLAQVEHGVDSQAVLVSNSPELLTEVEQELAKQLAPLSRRGTAKVALDRSYFVLTPTMEAAMDFSNAYAPEHLILVCEQASALTKRIINAGSVFLGPLTPESAGDYASGTNHTLPTGGFAKSYSGVSVDSFVKKITFQELTAEGLANIGETIEILAELEGLDAHKNTITIRR